MSVAGIEHGRPDVLRCRLVQVLAVVEDESCCRRASAVLVERACRRWSGRPDWDRFPPLQRWRAVEPGFLGGAEELPAGLIGAAAAGRRPPARDLAAALAAAVVLHSGCPALVQDWDLGRGARPGGPRRGVLVSIYGLREDDMALAESVLAGCVQLGALRLVERFSRRVPGPRGGRPVSASGAGPIAETGIALCPVSSPMPVRAAEPIAVCGAATGSGPEPLRRG
ncbi:hypothetical protein [Nocardia veterana]|uniref:Uncharacterized protein n=1 Tax=Nocardia veterana TaxID=132249 RepID=A0A7X6LWG7_9NOCA|nr:hypothetical protein [Nocardia veterana]NKY85195.1 hypothetical protein [Nocardia veterana]